MKAIIYQSAAVFILSIPNFLASMALTWTSYTEELLVSPESPLGETLVRSQVEMTASIMMIGSMFSVLACRLPDAVGRKKTEVLSGIIVTLAWSLIATARSFTQLLVARFLLGLGIGIHFLIFVVYINEFSQPFIRGTMACVPIFFYSFGTLISYTVGWFCSYQFISYMNLVISVVFTVAVNFLLESPVFLVTNGKDKDALKALKFYRGTTKMTSVVIQELDYLKKQREASSYERAAIDDESDDKKLTDENCNENTYAGMSAWRILVSSKATRRALLTVTSLCVLSVFMGLMAIQAYAGEFFRVAAPGVSPHLSSVVMAVAFVVGNALAVFITDLVPRRVMMISSCTACAACLGALSTMLRWSWAPTWAVPICMLLYTCAFTVGAGNLPIVQLSESFTPKVKTLASAIFMSSLTSANFIVLSLFGPAVQLLGLDGTFFLFFLITICVTVLAFLMMKETKGVPLEEIQEMYERGFLYWK